MISNVLNKYMKNVKYKNKELNPFLFLGFQMLNIVFNVSITSNVRYSLGQVIKMRYLLDQKDSSILQIIRDLFGFGTVKKYV